MACSQLLLLPALPPIGCACEQELEEEDWDTGDDRKPGDASAASRLGWGAGAKQAVAADYADMSEFEKERQIRDSFVGNLYEDVDSAKYGH